MQVKIKLIAFDVNGTLFDDTDDIFWPAINGVFEHLGRPPLPTEVLRDRFGQPWTRIYRDEGISEEEASDEELYRIYNDLYQRQPPPKPARGLKSTLKHLRKKGILLAVVSTQQNKITVPLLEQYGLARFFFKISGSVADKANALQDILKIANIAPKAAAYVGDQEDDMKYAEKAGYLSIAFTGGIHPRARLERCNPTFVIDQMSELTRLPIC